MAAELGAGDARWPCKKRSLQNSNMHRCRFALDKNTTIEILNQRVTAGFVKTPRADQTSMSHSRYAVTNLRCAVASSSPVTREKIIAVAVRAFTATCKLPMASCFEGWPCSRRRADPSGSR